jgi:hypothetical protein
VCDLLYLAEGRDKGRTAVQMVIIFLIPSSSGNFLTSWGTISFSRSTLLYGVRELVENTELRRKSGFREKGGGGGGWGNCLMSFALLLFVKCGMVLKGLTPCRDMQMSGSSLWDVKAKYLTLSSVAVFPSRSLSFKLTSPKHLLAVESSRVNTTNIHMDRTARQLEGN